MTQVKKAPAHVAARTNNQQQANTQAQRTSYANNAHATQQAQRQPAPAPAPAPAAVRYILCNCDLKIVLSIMILTHVSLIAGSTAAGWLDGNPRPI